MKITINANITPETIDSYLKKQKEKSDKIKDFCNKNGIEELFYKDSELEFEVKNPMTCQIKQEFVKPKPKVETRGGVKDAKN